MHITTVMSIQKRTNVIRVIVDSHRGVDGHSNLLECFAMLTHK